VGLDGEAAIGHGQETARGDTAHFRDEPALLCPRTNMLKHRIAMDYVKLVVVKGQRLASHNPDMMHAGVGSQNQFAVRQAGAGQVFPARVKLFEHVRLNACVVTGSDVQDAISMLGLHFLHEKIMHAPPGDGGNAPDKTDASSMPVIVFIDRDPGVGWGTHGL
jgi:hypothetical protein